MKLGKTIYFTLAALGIPWAALHIGRFYYDVMCSWGWDGQFGAAAPVAVILGMFTCVGLIFVAVFAGIEL